VHWLNHRCRFNDETCQYRHDPDALSPTQLADWRASAPEKAKEWHPCIAQCGSCKFGSSCAHANVPSDVCVHWLNHRCSFTRTSCKFRHDLRALTAAQAAAWHALDPTKGRVGQRHPCVVQCGGCKFGATCDYANVPGDVCVHWLNHRCRNDATTCKYRHATKTHGN
jgi:hypothetical protein